MASRFISNENKGVVWQLLSDNRAFANIPEHKFQMVKELYENLFRRIDNYDESVSLIDRNKLVISEMMKKIEYFKSQKVLPPLQEVKINLDKALETKQDEFIKLVKRPSQEEIDFSDKNIVSDKPIDNNEMDQMLISMMDERKAEFNLTPTANPLPENEPSSASENVKIPKLLSKDKSEKRVSFSDETTNFLNKIKKIEPNSVDSLQNESTTILLNKLLKNQEQILKQLNLLIEK